MVARPTIAGTLLVNAGDDLQAALNAARPGDTILLQPGATFTGSFVLPAKGGSSYITIRSAADDSLLPGAGARITPAFAGRLPKIQADRGPALATEPGATYWRLQFLELLPAPWTQTANLLELGTTGAAQSARWMVAANLVVDRCYIHGDAAQGQRRGIALNSADTQIVNSYLSDFKGVEQDTQAVGGWNGPGPFLIENNYIEAAAENIMFGGSDPSIDGLVPADITIRRNLITKPMEWRWQSWTVKNLIELKNAERVLIDGNVIENTWPAGQTGGAILMTPRNQEGTAPWSTVRHVVVQNNIIRHVGYGFNIAGWDDSNSSQQTEHIVIRNNLLYDVSTGYGVWGNPASAMFALIGSGAQTVTLDHNTVDNDGGITIALYGGYSPTGPLMWGHRFTNNLFRHNTYGLFGDATGSGTVGIAAYAPDAVVVRNTFADGSPAQYPSGNDFPALWQWQQDFIDIGGQDYRLRSSSKSKGSGTDGKDLGVDFGELAAAQSNAATATATGSTTNLALNAVTAASSAFNGGYTPNLAVDGNPGTRWSSEFSDPQWFAIDLGKTFRINRVVLRWETAYAAEYLLMVSDDAQNWRTVLTKNKNASDLDDLSVSEVSRYIGIYILQRGTEWGNSLWEFEVYGAP
jgi:hypothetical protein